MTSFATTLSCARKLLAGAVLMSSLGWLPAAAQDSTLTRYARQNQYPLQASGAQFSGAGWDKLRADILKSQFVLVGEDHGTVQIPQFTAAVARELKPAVYATEMDPYVAASLTRFAAQPGSPTAYLRQYPGALCFGSLAEEFELVRTLRAQQARVLGLDQVFIINAAPFYHELAGLAKGQAARTYLQRRAAAYQAQEQANIRQGSQAFVLVQQSPAAIDSLLAITKTESPAVQKMAQDYAASHRIYTTGSHQARLNLMKRNLLQDIYAQHAAGSAPAAPKMLFKFGALHVARGLSPVGFGEFYDVGNLVQNLADAQSQPSLHILILGKQGSKAAGLGLLLANQKPETYTSALYSPDSGFPVQPFMDQASGPAWSVFNLRPLRTAITTGKLQVPSQALQRILMGYDYLVVIPETTASRPL